MIPALHHDLFCAPVFPYRQAVIQYFVSSFYEQQITLGVHCRHEEFFPLPQVLLGQLVAFATVVALLTAEIGAQPHMRYTRRAPRLGEHTLEALTEAGFAPQEIDDLAARNVILDNPGASVDGS